MATYRFRAVASHSGKPMEVEIFLADRSHGFTPRNDRRYLVIETKTDQPLDWYAMVWNRRVAHGITPGGTFEIRVDANLDECPVVPIGAADAGDQP